MAETFGAFHLLLSLVGCRIYSRVEESRLWLILQGVNVFIAFLTFVFTSSYVIVHSNDILLWIEGACIWTTGVIMFISLVVCFVFRRDFKEFLEELGFNDGALKLPLLQHLVQTDPLDGKLKELKELVLSSQEWLLKYTRLLLKVYGTSVWLVATLYLCDPIYEMAMSDDKTLRLLAFKMTFPWSLENMNVYIVSFIFHSYCGYLCCVAYPGLQSTIILLNGQVIRQLKIIAFILNNLDEIVVELLKTKDERWQSCCSTVLIHCINHWINLKRFSNRVNKICRYFYLTLILVAILLVCVCSVKIAISDKLSPDTIKYYIHEFCFILMVLLFCYLGQKMQNESEYIEIIVTNKWYIYNRNHQVNVKIFHMALSQRMPIYIFGTITLSLPTFTWFIKTGMSFFTLVMSVFEE